MSVHKVKKGVYKVRWREGGRNRSLNVHGCHELAEKIERKKLSARDENRHLDIKREVNFRMSALIDRYWKEYGSKKRSQDREKSILEGIRQSLGKLFVREVEGTSIKGWYEGLTAAKGLSPGTAVRHFNVMHHMMKKERASRQVHGRPASAFGLAGGHLRRNKTGNSKPIYLTKSDILSWFALPW